MVQATQCSSALSPNEYQCFVDLVARYPQQRLFLPENPLMHTVCRVSDGYLVVGKQIGQGFWGRVFIASLYSPSDGAYHLADKRVVKIPYSRSPIGDVLNTAVNIHQKMWDEVEFMRQLYGYGESLLPPDIDTPLYVMPYLGGGTLKLLLDWSPLMQRIPLREWLSFFGILSQEITALHKIDGRFHNDINPNNILISLRDLKDENCLVFTRIHIADFGSVRRPTTFALPGRLAYQPPEFLFPSLCGVKVDVYELGKTFLEVLSNIKQNYSATTELVVLHKCSTLFERMTAFFRGMRPDPSEVTNELLQILADYDLLTVAKF